MEQNGSVKLKLPHPTRVTFITTSNGEISSITSTNGKLTLMRGKLYKVPVNTKSSLDDHHVFKTKGKLREILDVRNIENGIATIKPLIHSIQITDEMELGSFI